MAEKRPDRRHHGNLSGMFDTSNHQVGISRRSREDAAAIQQRCFSMVKNLSETVIIPIAGLILAFVMTYELITMSETGTTCTKSIPGCFSAGYSKPLWPCCSSPHMEHRHGRIRHAQHVVNASGNVIVSNTNIDLASVLPDMQTRLQAMELGPLFGLWFQSIFVG